MKITQLQLRHFRNYQKLTANFVPGVNLIVGDNAQGKTNLMEAITYLSRGHSFRTRREQELIQFGEEFAELQAVLDSYGRRQEIRMLLFAGRRPRQIFLGGVKQKTASNLKGKLYTVLFCPEDLLILKGGAAARRKLLDAAICQLRPSYEQALIQYQKLQEQKSRILKDRFTQPSLLEVLPEYNLRMAQTGAIIISHRAAYLKELDRFARQYHSDCTQVKEQLALEYQTVRTVTDPLADPKEIFYQLQAHQQAHLQAELDSMQCLSGPHKDDFAALLEGRPIKSFGSQGQTRTASIAIKLAEREIMKQDTGEEPVLLLDDVLSELDPLRQNFILNQIKTGQVFITCCEKEKLTQLGQVITVENGAFRKEA